VSGAPLMVGSDLSINIDIEMVKTAAK
jgi:hypothetical protein